MWGAALIGQEAVHGVEGGRVRGANAQLGATRQMGDRIPDRRSALAHDRHAGDRVLVHGERRSEVAVGDCPDVWASAPGGALPSISTRLPQRRAAWTAAWFC